MSKKRRSVTGALRIRRSVGTVNEITTAVARCGDVFTVSNDAPVEPCFHTALYFSVVTFTTLGFGDVTQTRGLGKSIVGAEVVLGYVMLGGLIALFANKLVRRE